MNDAHAGITIRRILGFPSFPNATHTSGGMIHSNAEAFGIAPGVKEWHIPWEKLHLLQEVV